MQRKYKSIIIAFCAVALAAASIVFAEINTQPRVVFSGIKLITNTNTTTTTTQGYIDVTLKNIDTTGLCFCLKYDKTYLKLSDVNSNEPIANPTTGSFIGKFNIDHTFLKQDTDKFPLGCFQDDKSAADNPWKMLGVADADNGYVMMNFLPDPDYASSNEYIKKVEADTGFQNTIMAGEKDITIGSLSFCINDPLAFIKLTESQKNNLIKVVPFKEMIPFLGGDGDTDKGITLAYINESKDVVTYSHAENHIDYSIDITAEIDDIKPQKDKLTVSAFELYNTGTQEDLIKYLNEKASILNIYYSDGSRKTQVFDWSSPKSITGGNWNPREGTYTVTKQANDDFEVSVTVHVTPVTLNEYKVDKENITYFSGSADLPKTIGELDLPKTAKAILEPYIPNCGIEDIALGTYTVYGGASSLSDSDPVPSGFESGGMYLFSGFSATSDDAIKTKYPWLTVPAGLSATVSRTVITDESYLPRELEVIDAATDENGQLTINVRNKDGSAIPSDAIFDVRIPMGEKLQQSLINTFAVNVDTTNKTATITIKADINGSDYNKRIAQVLNLGGRAGKFEIAYSTTYNNAIPVSVWTDYTEFSPVPRPNVYTAGNDENGNYKFDFSKGLAPLMQIRATTLDNIPKTITLPAMRVDASDPTTPDCIGTTYDGYYGSEPGSLTTFTVDGWTVTDGNPSVSGSVATIEGTLSETYYTDYGKVTNPSSIKVILTYLVQENENDDEIAAIQPDPFVFDTQTKGYGYEDLQTQTFSIVNTGQTDISGLSVNIELSKINDTSNTAEAFLLSKEPIQILNKGQTAQFDISTRIGLDTGVYTSKVTIMSNNGKELGTFTVKFEVSDQAMYKIKLSVKDPDAAEGAEPSRSTDMGSVKTSTETYTAAAGTEVTIIATPTNTEDYGFVGWTVISGDASLDDDTNPNAKFTVQGDVEIEAEFKELLGAKLRMDELYVMNTDVVSEENPAGYQLYTKTDAGAWQTTAYDKTKRDYYVVIPSDKEEVKVWFKPRAEAESADIEVTYSNNATPSPQPTGVPYAKNTEETYYKTDNIGLVTAPTENTVKISMTDSNDDEGEVTKTYTLHIFRKIADADRVEFKYGNSPLGLIMADASKTNKEAEQKSFIDNGYMFTSATVPANGTDNIRYGPEAWGKLSDSGTLTVKNYDTEDEFALFVNKKETFVDPGYKDNTLKDSLGTVVTTGVTKKIKNVKTISDSAGSTLAVSDFRSANKEDITITDTGNELKNKRILPDIYKLVYEYKDFDGSTISVEKPIIILSSIGDYNLDDTADSTDTDMVLKRFTNLLADENTLDYETGGRLYRYRVCDVNKDSHVNAIDANNIRAQSATFNLTNFYKNTQGGGP